MEISKIVGLTLLKKLKHMAPDVLCVCPKRGIKVKSMCEKYLVLSKIENEARRQRDALQRRIMAFSDYDGNVIEDGFLLARLKKCFKVLEKPLLLQEKSKRGNRGRNVTSLYH